MDIRLDDLPLGPIPRVNDPLGEFHCVRTDGAPPRYAGWEEPTNHWTFKAHNWAVGQDDGGRYLEQVLGPSRFNNVLITQDAVGRDFRVAAVDVRCDSLSDSVGLAFCVHTALDYLVLCLDPVGLRLCRREGEQFVVLAEAVRADLAGRWLRLEVRRQGGKLLALLDGQEVLRVGAPPSADGKVGLLANCPARFRNLSADGRPPRPVRNAKLARQYPRMKLVRKIKTEGFGTGRQLRFGDLTGDGKLDILLCQRDFLEGQVGYGASVLGCMTAMTSRGEVLWQVGTPRPDQPWLSGDMPAQINDIDGDGRNEVVCVRGFEFQVLDGATGKLKYAAPVPDFGPLEEFLSPERAAMGYWGAKPNPYPKLLVNCLRFADLAGRGAARDVLVKDAHHHLYALSPDFKPLWQFAGNIGHFPWAGDIDGDGRDEVVAGYQTFSADGRRIEFVSLGDHADAVFAGDVQGWGRPRVFRAGGDDGFVMSGLDGYYALVHLGHVQRLSIGKFRPDEPGFQYAICTYWGAPGIVGLIDGGGKLLWSRKYPVCGNTLQPTNWTGGSEELMYFSAHPDFGGLYNGAGEQAVKFPDDGHPERCSEVLDLLGTGRDNLIVWDLSGMWIYEPAGAGGGSSGAGSAPAAGLARRRRPPLHSWSNFMVYYSLPK